MRHPEGARLRQPKPVVNKSPLLAAWRSGPEECRRGALRRMARIFCTQINGCHSPVLLAEIQRGSHLLLVSLLIPKL